MCHISSGLCFTAVENFNQTPKPVCSNTFTLRKFFKNQLLLLKFLHQNLSLGKKNLREKKTTLFTLIQSSYWTFPRKKIGRLETAVKTDILGKKLQASNVFVYVAWLNAFFFLIFISILWYCHAL